MVGVTEPLRLEHQGRTAVVFAYHVYDRNVRFFLRAGLDPHPLVDFYIVHNQVERGVEVPNEVRQKPLGSSQVTWVKRPNVSNDWGAYAAALKVMDWPRYDYFLFINSSMRGPFLPAWYDHAKQHWSSLFTRRLNDSVALTGSSINFHHCHPHVQSMVMGMDQRALKLNLQQGVFWMDDRVVKSKNTLIREHEMAASRTVLHAGYNIDCLLQAYQGRDWRHCQQDWLPEKFDVWGDGLYYGHTIDPRETIFFKTNRSYRLDHSMLEFLSDLVEHADLRQGQPIPANQLRPEDTLSVWTNVDDEEHGADVPLTSVPQRSVARRQQEHEYDEREEEQQRQDRQQPRRLEPLQGGDGEPKAATVRVSHVVLGVLVSVAVLGLVGLLVFLRYRVV